MKVEINRQLLGLEDHLFGVGQVAQTRNGETVLITRINAANLPFDELNSLKEVIDSLTNLDIVALSIGNIDILAPHTANIDILAPVATDIDILSPLAQEIDTVALHIDEVATTAGSIAAVNIVSNDLSLAGYSALLDNGLITDPVTSDPVGVSSIESVSNNITQVVGVYNNLTSINSFFNTYYIEAVAPTVITHPNISVGDLWYDTTTLKLYFYDGVTWALPYAVETATLTFTNKTIDDITNTIGANHIHYTVRNITGSVIPAGTVVHAHATQPGTDYITVEPMTSPGTEVALGITHSEIAVNGIGLCMNTGLSTDVVNTSGWAVGTILYPAAGGGLTATKPATGWYQACAIVLRSHATQGTLLIEFTEPTVRASDMLNAETQFTIDLGGLV